MENKFYVGVVYHKKRVFKPAYSEKIVLYSDNNINYLDLISGAHYTTNYNEKDYVERESLVATDVSLYREDYLYLLNRYKENVLVRKIKK